MWGFFIYSRPRSRTNLSCGKTGNSLKTVISEK